MLVIVLKIMCMYVDSSVCEKKKCLISFLEAEVLIRVQGKWKDLFLSARWNQVLILDTAALLQSITPICYWPAMVFVQ